MKNIEVKIDSSKFKPSTEYVCWLDIMGTRSTMSESFEKSANFILRFHSCVVTAVDNEKKIKVYPVMYGVYISSPQKENMTRVLKAIMDKLSDLFISEAKLNHRFVVRGAIAKGEVAHGCNITDSICGIISNKENYKDTLMTGLPMIQVYSSEHLAPPFGIYIHESARMPNSLQGRFFSWCKDDKKKTLKDAVDDYFDWCMTYHNYLEMDKSKIEHYKQMNKEHLTRMQCTIDDLYNQNIDEKIMKTTAV